jgi:hypothetical protein
MMLRLSQPCEAQVLSSLSVETVVTIHRVGPFLTALAQSEPAE